MSQHMGQGVNQRSLIKMTPEEIDADLQSPDPDVRLAAGIASVGDAFLAFKSNKASGR